MNINNKKFELLSDDFENNGIIPKKFTCDAMGASKTPPYPPHDHPHFKWHNAPQGAQSFAIICEDIDSPHTNPWVHWVVYNISKDTNQIKLQLGDKEVQLDEIKEIAGIKQGLNSSNKVGYDAPCPNGGKETHRYVFTIYALDTLLNLYPKAMKTDLLTAMQNHILDQAKIVGKYHR